MTDKSQGRFWARLANLVKPRVGRKTKLARKAKASSKLVDPDSQTLLMARGPARVGARTKDLTKRLKPGDIAVINHEDIDLVAAEALVATSPLAVLNAAASTTGRYPNAGPRILHEAGILLVDRLGDDIMALREGSTICVDAQGQVSQDGRDIAQGTRQTLETIAQDQALAQEGLAQAMKAFAENTMEYVDKEKDLLLDRVGVPQLRTRFTNRHALVVVRGYHFKQDLDMLRPYIKEYRPVLIGVDGGADAILEAGYRLDMIVGDMDSVSDAALTSGAEVVVHAYRDGTAPGLERVTNLKVDKPVIFPIAGTSEDIALLIADDQGASLIVAIGTHTTLVELLDKGRPGMASTFLTRLRVGSKLVDAKGVSLLYRTRISGWQLLFLVLAGLAALVTAILATEVGQTFIGLVGAQLDHLWAWFGRWWPW